MTLQPLKIALCDQFAFHSVGSFLNDIGSVASCGYQTSCCCLKRMMITSMRFGDCWYEPITRAGNDPVANLHGGDVDEKFEVKKKICVLNFELFWISFLSRCAVAHIYPEHPGSERK